MILGIDPLYIMLILLVGMIGVVAFMLTIMFQMVKVLERIAHGTGITNRHLHAFRAEAASNVYTRPVPGHLLRGIDPHDDLTVKIERVRTDSLPLKSTGQSIQRQGFRNTVDTTGGMQRVEPER